MSFLPSVRHLSDQQVRAVRAMAPEIEDADGAPPLSDQALVQLSSDSEQIEHFWLAGTDSHVTGYAQIARATDAVTGEIAVAVEADRAMAATRLLDAIEASADRRPILIWSHGQRSPIGPVLAARGYAERRRLLQMSRPLDEVAAATDLPDVSIRPFRVGVDEPAWLAVNARAFADHAEQAGYRLADLQAREAEPWFDPAGFLLAVDSDGVVLGFHWTKIHAGARGGAPIGEVYVLGVDPAAQGRHLGGALLDAGLRHLSNQGVREVMLYSDEANSRAVHLYERSGFSVTGTDTQYLRVPG
ncbi:MAG: mycothiol synthase [Jatrophihabitans sp.]